MEQQHFYVDTAALRSAANRFDVTADIIDQVARTRLARLTFSGASAGRAHVSDGDALRRALGCWPGELARWSRASAEIAAALRIGAQSYQEAEQRAAAGVG